MDVLETCLALMAPAEHRQFCEQLKANRNARMDFLLAERLYKEREETTDLSRELYGQGSSNAYHSLRKRLQSHALRFLSSRYREALSVADLPPSGDALVVARLMIRRGHFRQALALLRRAERDARSEGQPVELDVIYREMMRHAVELELNPEPVAARWMENRRKIERKRQLEVASSLLHWRLHELSKHGLVPDLDDISRSILSAVRIDKDAANDVSFMFLLCQMVRDAVIRTKDYHRLEPFVGRIFRGFMRAGALTRHPDEYAGLLYMYAHVLYRNRKFDEAAEQLDHLRRVIAPGGAALRHLRPKYLLLRAAVKSYSGFNEQAAADLEQAITDEALHLQPRDRLNLLLNLSVYYFQSSKFKEAHAALLRMNHKESWMERQLGMEWGFKKNLIEAIILVELGEDERALTRLRYIESHYRTFFSAPLYRRAGTFVGLIRRVVQDPDIVRGESFAREIEEADLGLPGDREDIQAITFFCWIKSRINGTPYYEELLRTIRRPERT